MKCKIKIMKLKISWKMKVNDNKDIYKIIKQKKKNDLQIKFSNNNFECLIRQLIAMAID